MKLVNCLVCGKKLNSHNTIGTCRKHRARSAARKAYENKWKESHKEQYLNSMKDWRKTNREQYNAWFLKERKINPNYKIAHAIRNGLRLAVKRNGETKHINCSMKEFKKYLESKFKDGMSWDNYGSWEIDHIKPLSAFNLIDPKELAKACDYKNTQPLWKHENLSKRKLDYKYPTSAGR